MNGLEITMELLHFGVFSLVQQPLFMSIFCRYCIISHIDSEYIL